MDLFGITIERTKKEEKASGNQLGKGAHQDLGVNYVPLMKTINPNRFNYWHRLTFPDPSKLTPFEKVAYDHQLVKIAESLQERGSFSICPVTELSDLCNLKYTQETFYFRKQLQHLHCVKYANIPPDVLEQIPMMMSAIFTEGASLKDINHRSAEPQLLLSYTAHSCHANYGHYGGEHP